MRMWWRAKPWRWNYAAIYRLARSDGEFGRLKSVWLALRFPHVHQEELEFREQLDASLHQLRNGELVDL